MDDMTSDAYRSIVWLASYPKSGSTWLRCFLDAYQMGEVDINDLVSSVTDDNGIPHSVGDGSIPSDYPVQIQILTRPMAMLRLVRNFHQNKMQFADIPLFVKTHNANLVTNGIEAIPAALTRCTVHIIRDPRDVCLSFAKHLGKTIDETIELMGNKHRMLRDQSPGRMADFISSWNMHTQSWASADMHGVMTIRYEDMRAYPVEAFSRILEHAGLPVVTERVQKALDLVDIANLKKQESEKGFRESSPHAKNQFFGQGQAGGWKGKLTPIQQRRIEKVCESQMKRFGYLGKINPKRQTHGNQRIANYH